MMAKYLATSLAMLKVVSAPRVMRSCLPISTISISLVGLLSRAIMLAASLGGDGGCGQRVIACDHDRLDTHSAQLGEPLPNTTLDDVLKVDDAQRLAVP